MDAVVGCVLPMAKSLCWGTTRLTCAVWTPWIDSIVGNYGTITGISLALLRRLLAEVNVEIIDLWS